MTGADLPDDAGVDTAADLGVELPEDPEQAVDVLADLLLEARADADGRLDDLKRVAAEFENYRKRAQRDHVDMVTAASQRVAEALLPVLDSLDSAARTTPETPGEEKLLAGLVSTRDQILDVLGREGLRPIDAKGRPFDPSLHEAVSGGGDGHLVVVAELRRGYVMGDRLLRPAMVEVAAEDAFADDTEE